MKTIASCPRCKKAIVVETELREQVCPYCHQIVPTDELDPFDDGTGVKFVPHAKAKEETPKMRHYVSPLAVVFVLVGITIAILSFVMVVQMK
jgi:hypothetical protein